MWILQNKEKLEKNDEEVVECTDCKALVRRSMAQIVVNYHEYLERSFYCNIHRKPYELVKYSGITGISRYYRNMGEMECTETGELIGYKKVETEEKKNDPQ